MSKREGIKQVQKRVEGALSREGIDYKLMFARRGIELGTVAITFYVAARELDKIAPRHSKKKP